MSFSLDEMTTQIQSQLGLPYEKARAVAEQNLGAAAEREPTRTKPAPSAEPKGEKSEQLAIKKSAIARGAFVYEVSQPRATMQTPGIPDLYLVWPDRALWFEVKTVTGVLSQAQARFAMQCTQNGTNYAVGTHADFLQWCDSNRITPCR